MLASNGNSSDDLSASQSQQDNLDLSPSHTQKSQTVVSTRFSSVAGTETYMAPEIKLHYFRGTKPQKYADIELNKRQDVF